MPPTAAKPLSRPRDFLVRSGKITGDGWTLSLPKEWVGKVYVEQDSDLTAFYENGCYGEMGGGWLFSLETFSDESYVDRPDYELLSINGGVSYVAIYPTDVQFEGPAARMPSATAHSAVRSGGASHLCPCPADPNREQGSVFPVPGERRPEEYLL